MPNLPVYSAELNGEPCGHQHKSEERGERCALEWRPAAGGREPHLLAVYEVRP